MSQNLLKNHLYLIFLLIFSVGTYLCEGSEKDVQYFGKSVKLQVNRIEGQSLPCKQFIIESDQQGGGSVVTDLANLSLNDSIQCGSSSSTPDDHPSSNSYQLTNCSSTESELDTSNLPCSPETSTKPELDTSNLPCGTPKSAKLDTSNLACSTPKSTKHSSSLQYTPDQSLPVTPRSDISVDSLQFRTPQPSKHKGGLEAQNEHRSVLYKITSTTKFSLKQNKVLSDDNVFIEKKLRYTDIGGMEKQINTLKEMIEKPLKSPEMFKMYGKLSAFIFMTIMNKQCNQKSVF